MWPTVAILIITYSRPAEVRETLRALVRHVKYEGALRWGIADDGTPGEYVEAIQQEFEELAIAASVTRRKGWGQNVNTAMRRLCADSSYVFSIEDDYVAERELDLRSGVALMEACTDVGLVRYDGIAGHRLDLQLREAETRIGRVGYLRISKDSPDLNVYSNRPHLKHSGFHVAYGPYKEGLSLGATEEEFAHRVKDMREGAPDVACLASGIPCAFRHIGRSWQGTPADKNRG